MNKQTRRVTLLAFFIAVEIVLANIPFLGYIPLGVIHATTLHIPVIIAGILLGKKEGAIIGFVFGMTSMIKNTFEPTATSFVFSPFITIGTISGNWQSMLIAFFPRILLGYSAGALYNILQKKKSETYSILCAALLSAFLHTFLVMGGIYIFFGTQYAHAMHLSYHMLIAFIIGIITTNGIAEAIVGAILSLAVCKAGKKIIRL